jgi:hypothetical protein
MSSSIDFVELGIAVDSITRLIEPCIIFTCNRIKNVSYPTLLWKKTNGEFSSDYCVAHKCFNPRCLNIDHLYLVSIADIQANKKTILIKPIKAKKVKQESNRPTPSQTLKNMLGSLSK